MDFPTILVLATLITGVIWAIDALFLAPGRRRQAEAMKAANASEAAVVEAVREPWLTEYARSFFPIILAVLVIRSFVAEPFRIPSGSMMPTLLVGDFILVNKFAYGIRLPVLDTELIATGTPERGDIAVFRYPEDPKVDYIKRVVGIPGDQIVYRDKVLYINGEPVPQRPEGRYVGHGSGSVMTGAAIRSEQLGAVSHRILVVEQIAEPVDFTFTVPEDEYFVMGDNRDNSRDSRFWGTVPRANLVGEAFLIWWNIDCGGQGLLPCMGSLPSVVDWSRIGTVID